MAGQCPATPRQGVWRGSPSTQDMPVLSASKTHCEQKLGAGRLSLLAAPLALPGS